MKALLLQEYNCLKYLDLLDPSIKRDTDILVEIKACGICGSDVHGMDGSTGRRIPPIIMGHESAGIVRSAGTAVTRFSPGDHVAIEPSQYCGKCEACKSGRTNLCTTRKVLGISCADYKIDGAYAQYVVVPQSSVHHLPKEIPFEQGAPAGAARNRYAWVNITVFAGSGALPLWDAAP
jgi:D-arabinose 1-dehydrogenase-like Zn-dependent alcohol dehydrogenase